MRFLSRGTEQKAEGDAEYQVAQAEAYVEGAADRVTGKVSSVEDVGRGLGADLRVQYDQVVGAIAGDSAQELSGKAKGEKGAVAQEVSLRAVCLVLGWS